MYFDWRLWDFTKGVRGRISGAVAVGLLGLVGGPFLAFHGAPQVDPAVDVALLTLD